MTLTIATLFSGGEGVGVGARAAGIRHLYGIEYDERIAGVARMNGFHAITADVTTVDMHALEVPDILHASPVCKNFSVAKAHGEESDLDIQSGLATAAFIRHMRPKWVTLENVWKYRKAYAFKVICDALDECKYVWDVTHVNAADYGVPQTRKRLILRATRYGRKVLPPLPPKERWVGWYEAISDLIPTLPESKFAPWQLKRLPESIAGSWASDLANPSRDYTIREESEPFPTVCSSMMRRPIGSPAAFLADGKLNDYSTSLTTRQGEAPSFSLTTSHNTRDIRAYLVNESSTMEARGGDAPAATQVAAERNGAQRAFIMLGGQSSAGGVRYEDEPARTVGDVNRVGNTPRAFIINAREMHDHREENPVTLPQCDEPVFTLSATSGVARSKAWLEQGRVVKMTTRALARFQSFPDTYVLPENMGLACQVIGNAVAPLLYEKLIRNLCAGYLGR